MKLNFFGLFVISFFNVSFLPLNVFADPSQNHILDQVTNPYTVSPQNPCTGSGAYTQACVDYTNSQPINYQNYQGTKDSLGTGSDVKIPSAKSGTDCQAAASAWGKNYVASYSDKDGCSINPKSASKNGADDIDDLDPSSACGQAASSVNTYCTAAGYSPMAGQVAGVVSQVSSAQATGDYKSMCESSKKLNEILGVANASVSVLCLHAISSCDDSCGKGATGFSENTAAYKAAQVKCDSMQMKGVGAAAQVVQNYSGFAQSEICLKALEGKCIGQDAYNDPDCQQYCMLPGRQSAPQCSVVVASCGNPTYASQNATTCACVNNPTGTGCPGATGVAAATPNLNGLDGSGLYPNDPKNIAATPATGGGAQANTGFNGGSGGGSAPIGGAPAGEAKNTNDAGKDILLGASGSAGGYSAGGGGGYGDGGSGKGGAGGGMGGIDLRAFLPGGKNDPKRGIASIGGIDPSITSANGLSNFQKVTRKMNEKRVELMP